MYTDDLAYEVAKLGQEWAIRGEEFTAGAMRAELIRRINLAHITTSTLMIGSTYSGGQIDAYKAVRAQVAKAVASELGKTYPNRSPHFIQYPDPQLPERYLYRAAMHVTSPRKMRDDAAVYARQRDNLTPHLLWRENMTARMAAVGGKTTVTEMVELGLAPSLEEAKASLAAGRPVDEGYPSVAAIVR